MKNLTSNLPIDNYKKEIISAFESDDIVIITAETGSGKSTKIPQYIADLGYKVYVTEPRIIAATSLARNVEKDFGKNLVSYHTSEDSNVNKDTIITYCTDGIQVAKMISNDNKKENSCLIIDEVHEWNINIETLVAYIKYLKDSKKLNMKVILMSATIDVSSLRDYFNCPVLSIPGKKYEVKMIEGLPYLKENTIAKESNDGKNILIFEPGKSEIEETIAMIKNSMYIKNKDNIDIIPLHSELTYKDQMKIWYNNGRNKIIVATNIAQTSITIPYIDIVIDNGKCKTVELDEFGIECLKLNEISKSDIIQRKGRAGRTKDGKYYLLSNIGFDKRDEFEKPEIQRLSIDKVVLKLSSIGIDAEDLNFFHPVDKNSIKESKQNLKNLGALDKNYNITSVGKEMNIMPISPKYSRMIIEAKRSKDKALIGDISAIVSIIEVGSLVNFRAKDKFGLNINYNNFNDYLNENSDLMTELNIYKAILNFKFENLKESGISIKNFTKIKNLNKKLNNILHVYVNKNKTSNYDDILKCVAVVMVNNFFSFIPDTWYNRDNFKNLDNAKFSLDNKSCLEFYNSDDYYENIVFAFPKTIEYSDMWGIKDNMYLISMASKCTKDIIDNIFNVVETVDENSAVYHEEDKYFTCYKNVKIFDKNDDSKFFEFNKEIIVDKYNYQKLFERFMNRINFYIEINGKKFKTRINNGISYIEIENDEDIANLPNKLVNNNGEEVYIYYENCIRSLAEIKKLYLDRLFSKEINSYMFNLKIEVNSKNINVENFYNVFNNIIGEKTFSLNSLNTNVYIYMDYNNKDNIFNLSYTLDADYANSMNVNAMKNYTIYLLNKKYFKKIKNRKINLESIINNNHFIKNNELSIYNFKEFYNEIVLDVR